MGSVSGPPESPLQGPRGLKPSALSYVHSMLGENALLLESSTWKSWEQLCQPFNVKLATCRCVGRSGGANACVEIVLAYDASGPQPSTSTKVPS
eukprot:6217248-Prymnesium_polylepis.1